MPEAWAEDERVRAVARSSSTPNGDAALLPRHMLPPYAPAPFLLTLWTTDPTLAGAADAEGVDRVGVDLEHLDARTLTILQR